MYTVEKSSASIERSGETVKCSLMEEDTESDPSWFQMSQWDEGSRNGEDERKETVTKANVNRGSGPPTSMKRKG